MAPFLAKMAGVAMGAPTDSEPNPALGLVAALSGERGMFKAQLRGLLRASLHGRMRIMFPMVSGVQELRRQGPSWKSAKKSCVAKASPSPRHPRRHHGRDAVGCAGCRSRHASATSCRSAPTTSSSTRWRSIA